MNQGRNLFRTLVLILGFAFLYIPIVSLIVYSFNSSRLVTVWGGFSTKWYGALLRNDQILNAAFLSLKVAAISATLAVVLGTLAGLVLARFGPFKGLRSSRACRCSCCSSRWSRSSVGPRGAA